MVRSLRKDIFLLARDENKQEKTTHIFQWGLRESRSNPQQDSKGLKKIKKAKGLIQSLKSVIMKASRYGGRA